MVITTYCRPESLGRLLDDIEEQRPSCGLDLRVFDDGTPHPDRGLTDRLRRRGWAYRRADANHGKRLWWRWWNTILADVRGAPASHFYFLQDDMRLCERFFERSLALWSGITDERKASLDLHVADGRSSLGTMCWTSVRARRAGAVVLCGWVDCNAFMCERMLLDQLEWHLEPITLANGTSELRSSGVGRQLSLRAERLGLRMYRVERSLTVHDESPSLMNPDARRLWPMRTVAFVDGEEAARDRAAGGTPVFAALATIPARERGLERVVEALLPQVDALGVYLNGYERVPDYLDRDNVHVARSQESGDRGDAGKFFWAPTMRGHYLACDDDIQYPADYVEELVDGIERHGRRAVVGYHGGILADDITDYHASRRLLHLKRGLAADTPVHVLGTGVLGFHSSAIRIERDDFRHPNMADIWFALVGQRERVPFICLQREDGWLGEIHGLGGGSIYARSRGAGSESVETRTVRAHAPWTLYAHPAPAMRRRAGEVHVPVPRRLPRTGRLMRVRAIGPTCAATLVLLDHDHITTVVQTTGTYYERDLLDAIRDREHGGTFVDVGAHYGNHTAFFGLECAASRIVAVEPSSQAFAGLLETVAENGLTGRVTAQRIAVHPTWRSVSLRAAPFRARPDSRARTNSGQVEIERANGAGDAPAAPLDELLAGLHGIAVIKVDAWGPSYPILHSGLRVLRRERPLVAATVQSDADQHAVRALLAPLGYRESGRYCWTPTWLWEVPPTDSLS